MQDDLIEQLEADLRLLLDGEFTSLTIGFNDHHACNYVDAQEYHDRFHEYQGDENDIIDWVSEEERVKAISENRVWTCQWYPRTPAGFNCIGASSLSSLVAALRAKGEG
ncbi:hypothetical protein INR77_09095 [Erythrobacter sp. SCSIO 43205]|uniref:hypothetical protein n=1 Tax=Erythrobacter sp. SCSIO 43205 TaxID=2779361 RepID=UPI001CAA14DB|nr:hypothetical protein [Erythrobacter sp. SCSIO 43205]UAB77002.1 hypothetical protein INR77_09095 [Erythrobacter sp. SCSIO 43205]